MNVQLNRSDDFLVWIQFLRDRSNSP
jgi:hypothetical protein